MAKIPKRVSERLSKQTRKFQKVLQTAKNRDINEADTVVIIADMLSDLFGFDKYTDITREYQIRSTYCDLAVKVDDNVKFLIEVKAIGLDLQETHLRQAVGYGAQHGIQWVVLTNSVEWEIYRIKFERPIGSELLCSFSLLDLSPRKSEDQDILFLLCKEGISKAVIEEYHDHIKGVNKFIIGAILRSEVGLNVIRRELRRVTPGLKVDVEEVHDILISDVLKRDIIEGDPAKNAKSQVKKASSRVIVKRKPKPKEG